MPNTRTGTTRKPAGARAAGRAPTPRTAAEAVGAARAYADSVADGVIERDRAGAERPPRAELAALDASGLLGITVPPAHGGPELGAAVLAEVIATIAATDPSLAQATQSHWLFCDVLALWGSAEQQRLLFAEVLDGGRLGNGQAERGGVHAQDLKTRLHGWPAARTPWLTGKKYYTTGALTARWIGVTALDDTDAVTLAFVRRDAPGVALDTDWNVMGQRATVSGSARFDDVPVDPRLVIPYAGAFEVPQQLGARSQLVHAAIQVGIARGALRDARWFVRDKARPFFEAARAGWARTASEDPHSGYRFGQLATRVAAADALLGQAAAVLDEVGRDPGSAAAAARGSVAVAQAKAFATEAATEVASGIFDLSGASAADEKYDLSRHWRNARTHASHDPVTWKYSHIGNFLLNDVLPPNHGQFLIMTAVNNAPREHPDADPAGVSPAELREAMGQFATGVTVITSVGPDGEPVGTTANAVTSLSLEPPLILVCFDLKSTTLAAVRQHGAFAVNVLGQRQHHLSTNFAKRGLAAAWDDVSHQRGPTGSPRLADVIAVIECTVEDAYPGGDHEIVIGRVRHVETSGDEASPLVFWRGKYTELGGPLST